MAQTTEPIAWLSLVDVSGPFLAGTVLEEAFPQGLDKIETPRRQRLRAAYDEWQDAVDDSDSKLDELHAAWIRMVLEDCLEYDSESLSSREQLHGNIVYRPFEQGVEYFPDFAVGSGDGSPRLLIATYPPGTNLNNPLPKEIWLASPAERMVLLCRAVGCRIGLVTNGEQWMLVNAPVGETSGYASWYSRLWWQEPVTLKAFQSLLGVRRCFGPEEETLTKLLERSLEFQEEITNTLGEQVRRAVEVLIQSLARADQDRNGELLSDVAPAQLYEAGLTVMMRLVFILSAEERGLLLLGDPIYDQHYAVSTLRAKLREDADQYGVEVLERRHDAWSRLLATFRAIYGGVEHEAMRLPALGGSLFAPDRFPFLEGRSAGSKWREEAAVPLPIDNRTVLLLMTALQVIEQRGGARWLSYRALDVEQIGHVYEGLLEFTAARVPEIMLGLIGTKKLPNPQITLSELESLATRGEQSLIDHLKEITGRSVPTLNKAIGSEKDRSVYVAIVHACNGDEQLARRLLPFGELIRADSWGNLLVYRQGSFAIVKGSDRRSSGTHYTPRSLTEPIVRYAMEPLVYIGPAEGYPQKQWKLKTSAELLALKICDMACGSGAFLVEVCRYMSHRVVEAWAIDEAAGKQIGIDGVSRESLGDHEALPIPLDDRLLIARRLVAQTCIYGVDINHLAVELAKLSIWLVTLAKNKPFSFLDHALRCGDSLVGLHDLEQLRFFSLKPDDEHPVLFKGPLNTAVDEAIELRLKLEGMSSETVADVEAQTKLLAEAEDKLVRLKCAADLLLAAEFWGENKGDKEERVRQAAVKSGYYVEKGPTAEFQQVAVKERRGQRMFHWPLEFPEVIVKRGGFDAFIGNPPFMGAKKITGQFGDEYRWNLILSVANGLSGHADLCVYFVLRAGRAIRECGTIGYLTTNTIGQGESREIGLEQLIQRGLSIPRAVASQKWPGAATVEVTLIWLRRGQWLGAYVLDDTPVAGIDSFLSAAGEEQLEAQVLAENQGYAFQGSNIRGVGFILDSDEAERIVADDSRNKEVIFPYLIGQDINSRPDQSPSRMVINFFDWDRKTAERYRAPFEIVKQRVLPERQKIVHEASRRKGTEYFWHYDSLGKSLYEAIRPLNFVLARSRVSNLHALARIPTGIVFSDATVVFAFDGYDAFSILQSGFHTVWLERFSSTMRTDTRYTPSSCFDTFPFPKGFLSCRKVNPSFAILSDLGRQYYFHRQSIMKSNVQGLTKTYNRFHDPGESSADIQKLRDLNIEMDQAVAASYGWTDLKLDHGFYETKQGGRFTISELARREVLQRLLKLNHDRYVEEMKQGRHDKKRSTMKKKPRNKSNSSHSPELGLDLDE
jgi:hypothetical protein